MSDSRGLPLLAFVTELALFALLAITGARLGDGVATSVLLAVLFCAGAVLVWARWMAPRSEYRLPHPRRLLAQVALFAAACGLAVLVGLALWGVAILVVGTAVFTALGGR